MMCWLGHAAVEHTESVLNLEYYFNYRITAQITEWTKHTRLGLL